MANVVTRQSTRTFSHTIPCHLAIVNEYDEDTREGPALCRAEKMRSRKTVSRWQKQENRASFINAQPLHRRPAKPRLATRLWKISSTRRIPTEEEGPWNFYRVARTVLCSRIETLSRSAQLISPELYTLYIYI